MPYQSIVFMQGDDANEPLDLLYSRESDDSIVYHGPTEESVDAAFAYLRQWDYGEPTEEYDGDPQGAGDDVFVSDCGGYRMSASLSYGYIGLERIVAGDAEHDADPRVPGGRYLCGYWRQEYTVLSMFTAVDDPWLWFTVQWADGRKTTHCTPWDARNDRIVSA